MEQRRPQGAGGEWEKGKERGGRRREEGKKKGRREGRRRRKERGKKEKETCVVGGRGRWEEETGISVVSFVRY